MGPRTSQLHSFKRGDVFPSDMEPKYKPEVAVCRSKMCNNYANPSENGLCNACARVDQRGARRITPKARPVQVLTYDKADQQHDHSCCKGTAPTHADFTAEKTALRVDYCFGCGFKHESSHWRRLPRRSSKHWPRWELAFSPLLAEVAKKRNVEALPGRARLCPRFADYFTCYFHGTLSESDANDSAPHKAVDPLSNRAQTASARLASQRAAKIARETASNLSSGCGSLQEALIDDVLKQATEAAERCKKELPAKRLAELEELRAHAKKTGKRGRHVLASRAKSFLTFESIEVFDQVSAVLWPLTSDLMLHTDLCATKAPC